MHYRVHSRQMLCIGGSQIPFGWSFLSIAKVPMQWSEGDVWTTEASRYQLACAPSVVDGIMPQCTERAEELLCSCALLHTSTHTRPLPQVDLPAGSRVEYKYVIMEEQVGGPEDCCQQRAL